MEYKKILVILPHPDDEVFPMSGTLAKLISEGGHVTYVCLTLGEMGRNLGNPAFANRVTLPQVRRRELEASCGIIGIQDLRLLGYHDKTIEFEPHDALDERLLAIIKEVGPDVVFTYYPGHGVHPDHDACGAAAVRAVGKLEATGRPDVLCCAFPNQELGKPDVVVDVKPYIEQKLGTIRAHKSQFEAYARLDLELPENKDFKERIQAERFWKYRYR